MIGQIIGSFIGLAKSYLDAKTTEVEIKKKQLTGEMK